MLQSCDADGTQPVETVLGVVAAIPIVTLFNSTVVMSTLAMVATMRAVVLLFMAFSGVGDLAALGSFCQYDAKGRATWTSTGGATATLEINGIASDDTEIAAPGSWLQCPASRASR